jgi:hypothetical protein
MLKLTSLAIGLLAVIMMAPKSAAMTANPQPVSSERATTNLYSQVILKIGDRDRRYNRDRGYARGSILQQRRNLERQRDREADRRRDRYGERRDNPDNVYRRDR